MFSPALDLTVVHWIAKHSDESIITKGPQVNGVKKYDQINRNILDTFSVMYRNNTLLEVHPKERTLICRLKSIGSFNADPFQDGIKDHGINTRVWIIALLARPNKAPRTAVIKEPSGTLTYHYDGEESSIYYIFENGKIETKSHFGTISPYRPLKPNAKELEHFNREANHGTS
jgi:hypothetical protein